MNGQIGELAVSVKTMSESHAKPEQRRCNGPHVLIPYAFIHPRVALSWQSARWGYEREMISASGIIDLAVDRLCEGSEDLLEIELAGLRLRETGINDAEDLLRKLAATTTEENDADVERQWLFLCLAWLYENKESFPGPLQEVESIYANFDYPPEIEKMVRYMPATNAYDSSVRPVAENEARLVDLWRTYLDHVGLEFRNACAGA